MLQTHSAMVSHPHPHPHSEAMSLVDAAPLMFGREGFNSQPQAAASQRKIGLRKHRWALWLSDDLEGIMLRTSTSENFLVRLCSTTRLMIGALALAVVASPSTVDAAPAKDQRCIVHLHGKGELGRAPSVQHGKTALYPQGNASGWGGRKWLYFPQGEYVRARDLVAKAIEEASCRQVLLAGFSNGASFAAKLYCQGETFGSRLAAVVLDDPVPDAATRLCKPARGLPVTLYWTGSLDNTAKPGWDCREADWTCEGGTTVGIKAFASALGAAIKPSPLRRHVPYRDAPEFASF